MQSDESKKIESSSKSWPAALKNEIEDAVKLFSKDNQSVTRMRSSWMNFYGRIHMDVCRENQENRDQFNLLSQNVTAINHDLNNCFLILSRIDWQMKMQTKNHLHDHTCSLYSMLDIDHFHIEIQSIFDYVCTLISLLDFGFPKKAIGKRPSFGVLRRYVQEQKKTPDSQVEISDVVRKSDWFREYNSIRNDNIHNGGWTLVFPDKVEVLFQNYFQNEKKIAHEPVMNNENVADFRKYSVIATTRLINILEGFGEIFALKSGYQLGEIRKRDGVGVVSSSCPGQDIFLKWSQDYINELDQKIQAGDSI